LPRAIFFAHKLTCAGVAILGHFFIQHLGRVLALLTPCRTVVLPY
jgi:hypothetical protein